MRILIHSIDILHQPSFDECLRLLIEHLVFESDADVLQNAQGNEALSRAISTAVRDDIFYRSLPAGIRRVQGKISQGHAEPLNDHFVISGLGRGRLARIWCQKPEQLVSELYNVFILGGQLCVKIFVQLLVQGLCPNEVLLLCILSLATTSGT